MGKAWSEVRIAPVRPVTDARGWLLKVGRAVPASKSWCVAEVYVVQADPGRSRGHHYHRRCREWFTPIQGSGTLWLEDLESGQVRSIPFSGGSPVTVEVPPGVAHALEADAGLPLLVVAVASETYDPCDVVPHRIAGMGEEEDDS